MPILAPLASWSGPRRRALKRRLERLNRTYDRSYLETDPLAFAHRYDLDADREIVAFLAAGLAFGNVRAIQSSLSSLLKRLGPSPSAFVDGFDTGRDGGEVGALYHRWIRGADLVKVIGLLGRMRALNGSIGGYFLGGYRPSDPDIGPSLCSFSERSLALAASIPGPGSVARFFPNPRDGSACKRLNLFLRWMVRDGDGLDLGLWKEVSRRQLVLPLDTHLVRLTRALGLTKRRSPGWLMAIEATRSLALLDPDDPVKYDFSLSRLGILDMCLHGRDALGCRTCGAPRVVERKRAASRTSRPRTPPARTLLPAPTKVHREEARGKGEGGDDRDAGRRRIARRRPSK